MKTLFLSIVATCAIISSTVAEDKAAPENKVDIKSHAGTYTFNPTCTDEMAIVKVTFRKATEKEVPPEWRADGTLDNSFHGTKIKFTGAMVHVDDEGWVVVNAQFFGFKLKDGDLIWLPNYSRSLDKVEEGAASKAKKSKQEKKEKAQESNSGSKR